ncbi:MAG: hypothetical protein KAJ97_04255, partial [Acidobacteria bacterium]|nr:hypothetical protein [Acidobacteriota bacterium]
AEFGGATGGVINAVTRSGGNAFHGTVFVDVENNRWNGAARPEVEWNLDDPGASLVTFRKDDEVRYDPGFSLGGPILRDRLWFFATYRPGLRTIERTVDWLHYPPDTYRQDYRNDQASINLTANLSGSLLLKASATVSPEDLEGYLPNRDGRSGLPDQESWAPLGWEWEGETYSLTADCVASDSFVVSARGGLYHTDYNTTGIPLFDVIHNYDRSSVSGYLDRYPEIPPAARHNPGWFSNVLASNWYRRVFDRQAAGIDATWFVSGAGEHVLKGGFQGEEIANDMRSAYNADRIRYYWDRAYTTLHGESVRGRYGYFQLRNFSRLGDVATRNQALFIQDAWSVVPNLTLILGVRAEREEIPNYGVTGPDPAIAFDWGDKIAPRLGFAWDITGDARWKLYGSWGRYFDVTKYAVAMSFGARRWVDFFYTFDSADIFLNEAATCRTGDNTNFERPQCPAGTFIEAVDQLPNAADPAVWEALGYPLIDPDLKPMQTWEAQLGLDHQLTPTSQLGARYVHKELVRTVEDVGLVVPDIGLIYVIGNPGEGITTGIGDLPYAGPVREYDALELTFDKRFANHWSLRVYYTLSRLWGNYSGLANSDEMWSVGNPLNPAGTGGRRSPNVSRLWDAPGSMYDQNGDLVFGRLPTDRTHQLGAQLVYSFPFGLNLGLTQYAGSGAPISTQGTIVGGWFYPYGRGDLGETPWLTQTDLALSYTVQLGRGLGLSFGLTVLNLFDQDTPTRKWAHRQAQELGVTNEDFLTGFSYAEELAALGPTALDTRFGLWDTFQLPRNIRLTFKLEF